jgi:CheY-like chemotaxis protein
MNFDKPHIMIVDDNVNLGKTMGKILSKQGYEVLVATGGLQAIELAKENPNISLVFLDIKMPDINGVETYRRLRDIIPEVNVVMMTAYAVDDLIQEALHEGAQYVLNKPVEFDKISDTIRKVMKKKDATILIVDDDENTRVTLSSILSKKGFSVYSVESGEAALDLAAHQQFDLMFIDMKLPGIDGYETYSEIKTSQPNSITIIVTGYAGALSNRINQFLLSSAYSCLQKPLDMSELFKVIEDVLEKRVKVMEVAKTKV